MNERDEVFRNRLIAVMGDLNGGLKRDRELKHIVGSYASKLYRDARVANWEDLKQRANGPTYDSMLQLFRKHSQQASERGETTSVKALELLALSMIARRQYASDLQPGIQILDKFIEDCARAAGPRAVQQPKPLAP